jgi:guanosine-3',5'-bis(diphosphate) 3'-pyrophosphohydrolase
MIASSYTQGFKLPFAVQVALLHDTVEDTDTTIKELKENFGENIANAVSALSKDKNLPIDEQFTDNLNRIKKQPKEVWAVKLADRITNLQSAPRNWSYDKRKGYLKEAQIILDELGKSNDSLAKRLEAKISEYRNQNKRYLLDNF